MMKLQAEIEAGINETLFENRKRAMDAVKECLPRCSNGDPQFPEDIWMAARQIVSTYEEAMPVAAALLAERLSTTERAAKIAETYDPTFSATNSMLFDIAAAIRSQP